MQQPTREDIKRCVREAVTKTSTGGLNQPLHPFPWDARTDNVFRSDVRRVLSAVDEMCAALGLEFSPSQLPQQSIFKTFPRLANFCAYLEYRLLHMRNN